MEELYYYGIGLKLGKKMKKKIYISYLIQDYTFY